MKQHALVLLLSSSMLACSGLGVNQEYRLVESARVVRTGQYRTDYPPVAPAGPVVKIVTTATTDTSATPATKATTKEPETQAQSQRIEGILIESLTYQPMAKPGPTANAVRVEGILIE